jgi:hypothetical protein
VGVDKLPEDIRAVVGSREVEVDSLVEVAGNLAGEDILQVEGDTQVAGVDKLPEDIRAVVDTRETEVDSPAAAEADSSLPVEGLHRRRACRTWDRMCCPGSKACRSWGSRMQAEHRMRYRISGRGRYWRRTWGIVSIAAYYLSITFAKLFIMITLISKLCLMVFLIIYSGIK